VSAAEKRDYEEVFIACQVSKPETITQLLQIMQLASA
jgi:hypothetical protein